MVKQDMRRIYVLRMGHRPVRDHRITTHVGLVARAFGAEAIVLEAHVEKSIIASLQKTAKVWGGSFEVLITESPISYIRDWRKHGIVVHLTMYGMNIEEHHDLLEAIRNNPRDLLVVVGGKKVPREVYELADFNIAIGNQPHSEVAALAVFLDRLFKGQELVREFKGAKLKVIPAARGKRVVRVSVDARG